MQSRAWAVRVSGARCAPLTAPVGVLVKIDLHVQHHEGRCALSLNRRARRTSSSFRLSLLVVSLSLCVSFKTCFVSAVVLLSSLPALCFLPCRRFLSAFRLAGSRVLHSSLLSTLLPSVSFLHRLHPWGPLDPKIGGGGRNRWKSQSHN